MSSVQILNPQMGGSLRFKPSSWAQEEFVYDPNLTPDHGTLAPDVLYSGRLGSSKTRSGCEAADLRCRAYGGSRVAYLRRFRNGLGTQVIPEYLNKVITPSHRAWGWRPAAEGGSMLFYPNNSSVIFLGLDDPQRIQGPEFDLVVIEQCEELTEDQWNFASGRLRNKAFLIGADGELTETLAPLQCKGSCNPAGPDHFLFRKFGPDRGTHCVFASEDVELPTGEVVKAGDLVAECICSGPLDNMQNLPRETLLRYQRYPKGSQFYRRMILGEWIAYEGMVITGWDANLHVIRRPPSWDREWGGYPPPSWPRIRSIDFGYHPDPFVTQWWTISPSGVMIRYRVIYMTERTVSVNAGTIIREEEKELAALRAACAKPGNRMPPPRHLEFIGSYADHDAGQVAELRSHGVATRPATKDRGPGIEFLNDLIAPFEVRPGVMQTRMQFVRKEDALVERDEAREEAHKSLAVEDEVYGWLWDEKKKGGAYATIGDDHEWDAARYAAFSARRYLRERLSLTAAAA